MLFVEGPRSDTDLPMDIPYVRGRVALQAHVGLPDGTVEEEYARNGFFGRYAHLYRQNAPVGWTRIERPEDVEALAARIRRVPRVWTEFSTAIGQAMTFGMGVFDQAPACRRRVMDISSDGRSNEGTEPGEIRAEMDSLAIVVNALVIRGEDAELPDYFARNVMTGANAFVVTAESYDEYPERMRRKLRRETERPVSALPAGAIPARFER